MPPNAPREPTFCAFAVTPVNSARPALRPGPRRRDTAAAGGLQPCFGQPSWKLYSDRVTAHITRLGAHIAPVTFRLSGGRTVQPYAIAPWAERNETLPPGLPALLHTLRGDFFCLPFGANTTPLRGKRYPPHGETANRRWSLVRPSPNRARHGNSPSVLHAQLTIGERDARVDKVITLVPGHAAIYQTHLISGMSGSMPLGHHALLALPPHSPGGFLSTSHFVHGQVPPTPFEAPASGGYSRLRPGHRFRSLRRVALAYDPQGTRFTDLSQLPPERGFDDLVMLTADRSLPFGWSAVTFPDERYVWFALRDPRVLRHTILWLSHHGRHYAPWCGRHGPVLGIEDVTAYFHYGLAESVRPNTLSRRGFTTATRLQRDRPTRINYIMGVVATPPGFGPVKAIRAVPGGVAVFPLRGPSVHANVDIDFLRTGVIA